MKCPICDNEYKQITTQHLQKHKISVVDFKDRYPDILLSNVNAVNKHKENAKKRIIEDNIRCEVCQVLIESKDRRRRKFCSKSCSATFYNKRRVIRQVLCKTCNQVITNSYRRKGTIYCSLDCFNKYKTEEYIRKWLAGEISGSNKDNNCSIKGFVRQFLMKRSNSSCEDCGWSRVNKYTNLIPLQVHHIDGNSENTRLENLILLCPSCHSLTNNYGGGNKGNSKRIYRHAPEAEN
jgi:5-methylcytosine-specific restriction endonuclease McrA